LLDDPQVRTALEQMRRERMAQGVGRDAGRQPGPPPEQVEPVAKPADANRVPAVVEEDLEGITSDDARTVRPPRGEDRPAVVEVAAEGGAGGPAEQPDPLLAALAENANLAAAKVQ